MTGLTDQKGGAEGAIIANVRNQRLVEKGGALQSDIGEGRRREWLEKKEREKDLEVDLSENSSNKRAGVCPEERRGRLSPWEKGPHTTNQVRASLTMEGRVLQKGKNRSPCRREEGEEKSLKEKEDDSRSGRASALASKKVRDRRFFGLKKKGKGKKGKSFLRLKEAKIV